MDPVPYWRYCYKHPLHHVYTQSTSTSSLVPAPTSSLLHCRQPCPSPRGITDRYGVVHINGCEDFLKVTKYYLPYKHSASVSKTMSGPSANLIKPLCVRSAGPPKEGLTPYPPLPALL
ncbi:hypothetical protein PCANC_05345 [Puccinia coronata f. sp. avenae]|uniref:Uncharacterized protein n=1 Tax=Puccinia coronata f. sp. avenae TaxID=200324 RepID=A0A2N5VX85_9BASI|nr:hypothetical protein PCANC_05345 [Puccinia coronata f. sp. avenae]